MWEVKVALDAKPFTLTSLDGRGMIMPAYAALVLCSCLGTRSESFDRLMTVERIAQAAMSH